MEVLDTKIKEFLSVGYGNGYGDGYGNGHLIRFLLLVQTIQ